MSTLREAAGAFALSVLLLLPLHVAARDALKEIAAEVPWEPHVFMPMRDGVRLHGHVLLPGGQRHPHGTVLIRTPYELGTEEASDHESAIRRFISEGYAVVLQNERGRYLSEGNYSVLPRPREDGYDSVDWIARQPWSNGRVATYGCSSSAENQLALAAMQHPAHVASIVLSPGIAINSVGDVVEHGQVRRGGVFQLNWLSWFADYGQTDWPRFRIPKNREDQLRYARSFEVRAPSRLVGDWPVRAKGFPQDRAMQRLDGPLTEFETWIRRPPGDPAWRGSLVSDEDDLPVPMLWITGWFDYVPHMELALFEVQRQRRLAAGATEPKIVVGAAFHCMFESVDSGVRLGDRVFRNSSTDYEQLILDWLGAYLDGDKELQAQVQQWPAVRSHVLGAHRWEAYDQWPPGSSRPQTWYLGPDGSLQVDEPATTSALSLESDPWNPVPTMGGGGYPGDYGDAHPIGSVNQRQVERRSDVVTFTASPQVRDLHIAGLARVSLRLSTDVPDADVMVKICVVDRRGRSFNIAETAMRLSYRGGVHAPRPMVRGEEAWVSLPPMAIDALVRRGERLRLQVAPSGWPQYTVNTHDGDFPETSTTPRLGKLTLRVGGNEPSRIVIDVAPDR
jgi:hypothetical protein